MWARSTPKRLSSSRLNILLSVKLYMPVDVAHCFPLSTTDKSEESRADKTGSVVGITEEVSGDADSAVGAVEMEDEASGSIDNHSGAAEINGGISEWGDMVEMGVLGSDNARMSERNVLDGEAEMEGILEPEDTGTAKQEAGEVIVEPM